MQYFMLFYCSSCSGHGARTVVDPRDPHPTLSIDHNAYETNCARGDTICLRPLQVDNIFAFIRQVPPVLA